MGPTLGPQANNQKQHGEEHEAEQINYAAELKQRQQSLINQLLHKQAIEGELLEIFKEVIEFYDKSKLQRILQQIDKKFSELARKDFRSTFDLVAANISLFLERDLDVGSMAEETKTYPIVTNNGLAIIQAAFHLEKVRPPKPKKGKVSPKSLSHSLPEPISYSLVASQKQSITLSQSQSEALPHSKSQQSSPQPQPNTFLIFVFKVVKPEAPKTRQDLNSYFQFSGIEPREERQRAVNTIWATYESKSPKSPEELKKEAQRQALLDRIKGLKKNKPG